MRGRARGKLQLQTSEQDKQFGGSQKGGFQKGGVGGCSPTRAQKKERRHQSRNEGFKNGTTVPQTGTRVHGPYPPYGWDFAEEFRKNSGKTPATL